jgi:hypothetical protein
MRVRLRSLAHPANRVKPLLVHFGVVLGGDLYIVVTVRAVTTKFIVLGCHVSPLDHEHSNTAVGRKEHGQVLFWDLVGHDEHSACASVAAICHGAQEMPWFRPLLLESKPHSFPA